MSVEIQTMGEGGIFEIAAVVIDEVLEIQPFTDVEYEILSSARDILAEGSILEAATVATNSANTAAGLASEAASAANGAASAANDAAGLANSATTSANTAAGLASEAASAANDAAGLANSATTSANTAAGAANSAATSATSAAGAANTAASSANSAASAANTAAATAASFVGTGPAGYYATLTALQSAYPTGDTGIYVELEYGHWYYWSGGAWIDGGLFQAPLAVVQTTGTSETDVMSQKAVTDEITQLESSFLEYSIVALSDSLSLTGFLNRSGDIYDVSEGSKAYAYSPLIPISTKKIRINAYLNYANATPAAFYDVNENFISSVIWDSLESIIDLEVTPPNNAKFARFSTIKNYFTSFKIEQEKIQSKTQDVCYVSTIGDDSNSGNTENTAVQTIKEGISRVGKNGRIVLIEGDYFNQRFDFASIKNITSVGRVRLIFGHQITSAEKVSGYTKVYKANYIIKDPTNTWQKSFLWQHDIDDENTLIDINERHALHEGRRTRLPSTRVYEASNIDDIESSDVLKYFQDGEYLYFSKTEGSDLSVNPIIEPLGDSGALFSTSMTTVNYSGFEVLYAPIKLDGVNGEFTRIVCGMGGRSPLVSYSKSSGIILRNCEAYGSGIDGFSGSGGIATTEDNDRDKTIVYFHDCYGHDNADDGESSHWNCVVFQYGGLYEYNGNGVTPASGAHASYHNTICRSNGDHLWFGGNGQNTGFSAEGASIDSGIGTNIYCHNCLSIDNSIGFRGTDFDSKFISCISKNDAVDYVEGEKINCVTI